MKMLPVLLALFLSLNAYSGELDNVFSEGVFGTEWGQSSKEVAVIFPSGKKETSYGSTRITVEDGREVLGLSRSSSSKITFVFDTQDRLFIAGVAFDSGDDYAKLMRKLDTLFGGRENLENDIGATGLIWKDEKTKLSVIYVPGMFSSETILNIEHLGLQKNTKSKEDLGF
tara:strand:+ start:6376 stop:6888 length:513 start_codon:yes stop_codon:yes gene_type:complete